MTRTYTQSDFEGFLSTAGFVLSISNASAKTINESLAPNFSLMDLLMPDELRLSNLIAELLNPSGHHGQGHSFLQAFLSVTAKRSPRAAFFLELAAAWSSPTKVTVRLEVPTMYIPSSQRRMDILLEGAGYGLMIENKPWAGDQQAQLRDYATALQQQFGERFAMIYLTGAGHEPSVYSIPKDDWSQRVDAGRAISLSYQPAILEWLAECERSCRADAVRAALRDVGRYVGSRLTARPTF